MTWEMESVSYSEATTYLAILAFIGPAAARWHPQVGLYTLDHYGYGRRGSVERQSGQQGGNVGDLLSWDFCVLLEARVERRRRLTEQGSFVYILVSKTLKTSKEAKEK